MMLGTVAGTKVKVAGCVLEPAPVVTTTWPEPATCAGLVTEIVVEVLAVIVPLVPLKETDVGLEKFVPTIVTAVPPVIGPEFGTTWLMIGADMFMKKA